MMNYLGKGLAFVHAGLSVMLMFLALAIYFNAVDFGWKEPARYWREAKDKKGQNLLVPSLVDTREAALRQQVRVREDQLGQLDGVRTKLAKIDMVLSANHLEGQANLRKLYGDKNTAKADEKLAIRTIGYNDNGLILKAGSDPRVGFPDLPNELPKLTRSYAGYLAKLKELDAEIDRVHASTKDWQAKQEALTKRMIGKLDDKGNPERDKSGSVIDPGWGYLVDMEFQAQRELQKELEHVQPLWVKELVDAQLVKSRRDGLVRRLNELVGESGYLSDSEFQKKGK